MRASFEGGGVAGSVVCFVYFLAFVAVSPCYNISLLFILFPTVHRKTNFLVNLYWDNKYSDSDSGLYQGWGIAPSVGRASH